MPGWQAGIAAGMLCAVVGCAPRVAGTGAGLRPAADSAPQAGVLSENSERLARLYAERVAARTDGDYVLGKGDLLAIHAFDVDEVNQKVRVDGNGTITLPLLSGVPVGGHTLAEVQQDLTKRLSAFMYDPQVSVFVEEYRGQQIAVLGAVHKPGLVSQTGRNSTVLDTISAAGGMTAEAGSRIFFMPAETRQHADVQALAAGLGGSAASATVDTSAFGNAGAIVVDTKELDEETKRFLFTLPVHDGDVIMVPTSGNFFVSGWFNKPGPYPLRSGLTLRGAVATAGGFSFPAKQGHVRIYRPGANGETEMRDIDYGAIASLAKPDVFIHEGDVVDVSYSTVKVVPYGAYKLIADLVHLGIGTKVAP